MRAIVNEKLNGPIVQPNGHTVGVVAYCWLYLLLPLLQYIHKYKSVNYLFIDHITCAQSIENGVDYEESINSPIE